MSKFVAEVSSSSSSAVAPASRASAMAAAWEVEPEALRVVKARVSKRHLDRVAIQSEFYDPEGALDAGMLDELAEPDACEARAVEVAAKLGALPQPTYARNKRIFRAEMAERVTSDALQILGGSGYTTLHAVERYWRDARLTKIFEGTSEIQLRIISDRMLGKPTSRGAV